MSNITNITNATIAAVVTADPEKHYEWWRFVIIILLSLLSALFSGLNLGIISLDIEYLELLKEGPFENKEDEINATYAKRILPLRRRGNLLICTILLGNVAVNSILSIIMADLTSGIAGLLITTGIVLVFGEVIPQAVCSRYALVIGAHTMWILMLFVILTFPISFPLSAILDKLLGEEVGSNYNKNKMKQLFQIYEEQHLLDAHERKILDGALDLRDKTIEQVMTPLEKVYMLEIDSQLDKELLKEIYSKGYSRIPIYEGKRENIVSVLISRDLILINPDKRKITIRQLSSMLVRFPKIVDYHEKLLPVLTYFKKGQSHMAVVTKIVSEEDKDPHPIVIGIITLEDIIEEIVDQQSSNKSLKDRQRDKLIMRFSENLKKSETSLNEVEAEAVCEFLWQHKEFKILKKSVLIDLLTQKAQILDIHSEEPTPLPGQKYRIPLQSNSNNQTSPHKFRINFGPRQRDQDQNLKSKSDEDGVLSPEHINLESKNAAHDPNAVLYVKGQASDEFTLILLGKVVVESGNDGFIVQLSTFSHFGLDCLTNESYIPDFTAKVNKYARILKLKRVDYLKARTSFYNL